MLRNDWKRLILSRPPAFIDCVRFPRCCYATVERMEKEEREREGGRMGGDRGIKGRPISKGSRRNSEAGLQSEPCWHVCRNVRGRYGLIGRPEIGYARVKRGEKTTTIFWRTLFSAWILRDRIILENVWGIVGSSFNLILVSPRGEGEISRDSWITIDLKHL